ncbi:MAG: hypothetical protein KJT03_03360 [Verrucomicrobiae bacterium]|nr:hypothetical protein [Verrucomicrobiae bacterium]
MAKLEVCEVKNRKDLREFILFPFSLYEHSPYWIPPLIREELTQFDRNKNPAFEFCQMRQWMVRKNGKVAGRIAGIVHKFEVDSEKTGRFGWIDFIDDLGVSQLLLEQVEGWLKPMGIGHIHGPFGFSDMDPEGMLVRGFDSPATITTIYNYDYYPYHLEKHGYEKSVDWIEWIGDIPKTPDRLLKASKLIERKYKVRSKRMQGRKEMIQWAPEMFNVLNQSFQHLHGFQTLSPRQIQFYVFRYLSFVNPDFISIIVNDKDEIVGFAIAVPSLSEAFRKARGRLFPFGAFQILRALKKRDEIDLYLIGVRPDYQRKGIVALIFRDLFLAFERYGFKWARSTAILEGNNKALKLFSEYQDRIDVHKRRRCYKKSIS